MQIVLDIILSLMNFLVISLPLVCIIGLVKEGIKTFSDLSIIIALLGIFLVFLYFF